MSAVVYVVTHKKINTELPDYCKKTQINVANTEPWEGYIHDNCGQNISEKNPYYCELTALYHLWKNCDAEYKGLYHYRRYFADSDGRNMTMYYPRSCNYQNLKHKIVSEGTIQNILNDNDIILAVPHNPFPATVFEALTKFVSLDNIRLMIELIEEIYPDYYDTLWDVLESYQISYCNMFVASSAITDMYCKWLFSILETIEQRIPKDSEGNPPKRVFGYYAEVLLNVYVKNNKLQVKCLDMLTTNDNSSVKNLALELRGKLNCSLAAVTNKYLFGPGDKNKLYFARSDLWRGKKSVIHYPQMSFQDLENYYRNIGAVTTELKNNTKSMSYLKVVMNYSTANECFLCYIIEKELFINNSIWEKDILQTVAEERDKRYHIFVRIYTDCNLSDAIRRNYLLRGYKCI